MTPPQSSASLFEICEQLAELTLQASEIVRVQAALDEKLPLNVAKFFESIGKVQLDIAQVIVMLHRRM